MIWCQEGPSCGQSTPGVENPLQNWAQGNTLSLTSCVALGKWLGLSGPQFPLMSKFIKIIALCDSQDLGEGSKQPR